RGCAAEPRAARAGDSGRRAGADRPRRPRDRRRPARYRRGGGPAIPEMHGRGGARARRRRPRRRRAGPRSSACDNHRAVASILAPTPFVRAIVTNFFFFLGLNGFVLLPLYIQQLGGNEIQIGMVMGLFSGVGIVCQPLIGPWVDVIGRRPFMLVGIGLTVAATLLAAVPGGVPLLAVVRAVQGIGFSMFFVASFSFVLDIIPPAERGWALGIYGVSGFVSTAVAPLFGEWIIRTVGFRVLFALSSGPGVVTFALVWPVREAPRGAGGPLRLAPGAVRAALEDVLHRHMFVTMFFGLRSGTVFAFLSM